MVPKGGLPSPRDPARHRSQDDAPVVGIWFEPLDGEAIIREAAPCELVFSVGPYDEVGGEIVPYRGPRPVRAVATVFAIDFDFERASFEFTIPVDVRSEEIRFRGKPLRSGEIEVDLLITESSTALLLHHAHISISVSPKAHAEVYA